ncbi:hypothetical protein [Desulfosarcina sp.]|uniref:hypothetical protein n=1 Tax=Desulfosarcina sp. TaxID=2027861 RepID=UPI0029C0E9C6|nr:hypothetical protein [Desulfosarcina sp.]
MASIRNLKNIGTRLAGVPMPVTAVQPVFSGNGFGEYGRQLLGADEKADVSSPANSVATSGLHSHALSRMRRLSR